MKNECFKFSRRKLPYKEGSVFAIPFKNGGYTLGVVARATGKGGVLGYFYETVFPKIPLKQDFVGLDPNKAILKIRFGDPHLLDGRWKILGELENFIRTEWPIPKYIRRVTPPGCAFLVQYDDDNIHHSSDETKVPFDTQGYWYESVYGCGAVEIEVERAIITGIDRPLPYQEGSVFALPLKRGGCVLGVVARITKVGEIAFVYIFGKKFSFLPDENICLDLSPKDAILKPRVFDTSLQNGYWPILGKIKNWKREEWPMPTYFVKEEWSKNISVYTYREDCPGQLLSFKDVPLDYEVKGLEKSGWGAYGNDRIEDITTDSISPHTVPEASSKSKRSTSKKKKLPYHEGTIFAIPLKDGGYGIGVVARFSENGIVLGYLYKARYSAPPNKEELPQLDPNHALLKLRMGDDHLLDGLWPIIGEVENWKREEWPIPQYIHRSACLSKVWLEIFSDDKVARFHDAEDVPYDTKGYLPSIIYDPDVVAFELTQAISYGVDRPLSYQEGSVLAIPLKTGGYVLGVVARTTKVGEVAVVYVFGKKFSTLPTNDEWSNLDPNKAILRPRILDTGMQNGKWPILGSLQGFKKEDWPMPQYIAREKGFEHAWLETYKESCPAERLLSKKVSFDYPAEGYEEGSLFGPYRPSQIEAILASQVP